MPENIWVKMRKRLIFGLIGGSADLLGKRRKIGGVFQDFININWGWKIGLRVGVGRKRSRLYLYWERLGDGGMRVWGVWNWWGCKNINNNLHSYNEFLKGSRFKNRNKIRRRIRYSTFSCDIVIDSRVWALGQTSMFVYKLECKLYNLFKD